MKSMCCKKLRGFWLEVWKKHMCLVLATIQLSSDVSTFNLEMSSQTKQSFVCFVPANQSAGFLNTYHTGLYFWSEQTKMPIYFLQVRSFCEKRFHPFGFFTPKIQTSPQGVLLWQWLQRRCRDDPIHPLRKMKPTWFQIEQQSWI